MSKTSYIVSPKFKKSSFSNEYWTNKINNKIVTIIVTVMWRWSSFSINLNDDEKEKEENLENLLLSDYDYDFIETDDGCERFIEIKDEKKYSEDELNLIYKSMYEDLEEEYYDETYMEENGWDLSDTTYEISDGVDLTEDI